ncbi:MAG: response regulator transcription factor [Gallionellaceae bacterium]|jgi:DNA-binding response OmpR family regulator
MATRLNIVLVEDHDALRKVTVEALRLAGHLVTGVDSAEALNDISTEHINLIVIDLNLPGEDGISLAKRLRASQPELGIIMLTARAAVTDKLIGYESGADIYLTKPTSVEELNAAIFALKRRLKAVRSSNNLTLDRAQLRLDGPHKPLPLTLQEADLLTAFIRAPHQQMENWQLIELLGKGQTEYKKSALEVQMVRLRKKLIQAGAAPHPIKVIRGYGYQLCESISLHE